MVKRLLEAKAAVDAKDLDSRGLGGGFGGKSHEAWNCCEEVNEHVDGSKFFMIKITSFPGPRFCFGKKK